MFKSLILFSIFTISLGAFSQDCLDAYTISYKREQKASVLASKLVEKLKTKTGEVIIDIGGEGRYLNAININPQALTSTTGESGRLIPNWIPGFGHSLPFRNRSIDLIYLENAPLTDKVMNEVHRVLKVNGELKLTHPREYVDQYFYELREKFQGSTIQVSQDGGINYITIKKH